MLGPLQVLFLVDPIDEYAVQQLKVGHYRMLLNTSRMCLWDGLLWYRGPLIARVAGMSSLFWPLSSV